MIKLDPEKVVLDTADFYNRLSRMHDVHVTDLAQTKGAKEIGLLSYIALRAMLNRIEGKLVLPVSTTRWANRIADIMSDNAGESEEGSIPLTGASA